MLLEKEGEIIVPTRILLSAPSHCLDNYSGNGRLPVVTIEGVVKDNLDGD
jgi:hypothetical protein